MSGILSSTSGSFIVRGVVAVILGILAILFPGPTLAGLLGVFAAYAIVDGIFAIYGGAMARGNTTMSIWIILGGIAAIALGVLTLFSPETTALVLVLWIGILSITRGISEVAAAITFRQVIRNAAFFALSGLVSIVFGIFLVVAPGAGALSLLWIIGYYALFTGVMYLAVGFRMRGMANALGNLGRSATART